MHAKTRIAIDQPATGRKRSSSGEFSAAWSMDDFSPGVVDQAMQDHRNIAEFTLNSSVFGGEILIIHNKAHDHPS
jgi:hypothetical protein